MLSTLLALSAPSPLPPPSVSPYGTKQATNYTFPHGSSRTGSRPPGCAIRHHTVNPIRVSSHARNHDSNIFSLLQERKRRKNLSTGMIYNLQGSSCSQSTILELSKVPSANGQALSPAVENRVRSPSTTQQPHRSYGVPRIQWSAKTRLNPCLVLGIHVKKPRIHSPLLFCPFHFITINIVSSLSTPSPPAAK